MKVLIDGVEKDLMPYKGNPNKWYDGVDETQIFSFGELRFPVHSSNVTQTVSRIAIKTKVRCSVTKTPKSKPKASKSSVRKCKNKTLD